MELPRTARAGDASESRSLVSAILLGVVGPEVFIVQPGFVQGMVQNLVYSTGVAPMRGLRRNVRDRATTVAMTFAAHRFNWRRVVAWSLAIMVVANVACALVRDVEAFAALRFAAGIGAGGLISLSFAAIVSTRRPDRNFGYLAIMWVLMMPSPCSAWSMAPSASRRGRAVVLRGDPRLHRRGSGTLPCPERTPYRWRGCGRSSGSLAIGLALAAMFAYFLAQGVVVGKPFLIGIAAGLAEQQVGNGLTVSQFAGIAGARRRRDRGSLTGARCRSPSASSAAPRRSTFSSAGSARPRTWSRSASTISPGTSPTHTCSARRRALIGTAVSSSTRSRCRCSGSPWSSCGEHD